MALFCRREGGEWFLSVSEKTRTAAAAAAAAGIVVVASTLQGR
jgi:hypothetical protein